MLNEGIHALWGGILIGIAVSLMLLWNGRVTGISGIIYGLMNPVRGDLSWRLYFIAGLVMGGFTLQLIRGVTALPTAPPVDWTAPVAGFLVGFGTVLGSGCTSGHGVCGISRMSPRSLVATVVFIVSGVVTVFIMKRTGVLQ